MEVKDLYPVGVLLKINVLSALSLMALLASAETFSLAPVEAADQSPLKSSSVPLDANVVKVTGRGVGTDHLHALEDAYRDAVECAVGLYVDAEQMAKNDEIVSDQILTQSNAYIEKYEIIKESAANGLVTIKILALVRKQALTKRMKDVMPPQTYDFSKGDAANAHAQMVTEVKRNEDAVALVQNYFKDFNPVVQLMKVGLASVKPQILKDSKNVDSVELAYPLKIEVDQKKYFEVVMPGLKKLFDQISLTEPKTIRLADVANMILAPGRISTEYDVEAFYKKFMSGCGCTSSSSLWDYCPRNCCYTGLHAYYGNVHGVSTGISSSPIYGHMDFSKADGRIKGRSVLMSNGDWLDTNIDGEVLLLTSVNASGAKAVLYSVDSAVVKVLVDWQKKIQTKTVEYNIVFKDSGQEEIGGFPWIFEVSGCYAYEKNENGCGLVMNCGYVCPRGSDEKKMLWMFSPHIRCWADQYLEWRKFSFKASDISRIASVSIEVVE